VTLLENKLQGLPERMSGIEARVGSLEEQFVQFRIEVRGEFSTTREELRAEIRAVDVALHKKFDTKIDELGGEMRTLFENALERIRIMKLG
jgi:hypothetical protein